jgi:glutamate-1-semialdehyde aminotransferase
MQSMKNSKKFLIRAKKLIPALSQTFSKAPYSYVEGVYPTYLSRGKGSHVFDVDDNKYIDYVLGLGPIILGYAYTRVDNAIKKQLKNGISFSIPHKLEVEFSEKISSIVPGVEMIRFSKTGSDAGTGAVRAARAFTKRDNIAYCGSGGVWHDWFTVITSRNAGIPKVLSKMIKKFNYNDIDSLKILFENWKEEIAAVYMEPIFSEYPKNNFLQKVKQLSHKYGAVLIFDEVITGFRFAKGGAQELLKVEADLAVFGKGIGNGMPLGAITGKAEIMKEFDDVFYSTTYGGETLSLAAGCAVIDELKEKPVIKHCWKVGEFLMSSSINCLMK